MSPLSVAGLMRARVFGERTTVLTSATLLGGDFTPIATSVGLKENERLGLAQPRSRRSRRALMLMRSLARP